MRNKLLLFLILTIASSVTISAQDQGLVHKRSETYVYPKETEVLEKLDSWQDIKFGMLIHWGLYAQWGIVESWSICAEEEDWIKRDTTIAYDQYKRNYWALKNEFNPVNFNPKQWAQTAIKAGMKYVVFTTKHHDGFCMFDTNQTDFKITNGAFAGDPRSNIAKEVFDAFRNEGHMIGAYFSKPDWHSQYYWWDRYATPNRAHNYDIRNNQWRWNKFKEFTYNQLEEIVNGDYGAIDILWLDGGWVRPFSDEYIKYLGRRFKGSPDIDMPKIAAMARGYQSGMIIVDRSVPGEFENYQTPERGIPDVQLLTPWESCITLGDDWGWVPDDKYKSPTEVVHILAEIVAKGGNFVLGIGPKADGTLPDEVVWRLEEIGEWLTDNGEAIYNTRVTPYYNDGSVWFTASKDGSKVYAIACMEEGKPLPRKIVWKGNMPADKTIICLQTGKPVRCKTNKGGEVEITLPKGIRKDTPAIAFAFNVIPIKVK